MTQRCVAFLRGINVGRANRVAMGDLRAIVASLGYRDPRTLLNSGNVVFTAPDSGSCDDAGERLEEAVAAQLGVAARVTALNADEFAKAVAGNPWPQAGRDASRLLVGFLGAASDVATLEPLTLRDWRPELLATGGRVVYAWCPDGVTGSPVLAAVAKLAGHSVTMRNWGTVLKVRDLLDNG